MRPLGRTRFCCSFCEQKSYAPQQPMAPLCSQTAFSVPSLIMIPYISTEQRAGLEVPEEAWKQHRDQSPALCKDNRFDVGRGVAELARYRAQVQAQHCTGALPLSPAPEVTQAAPAFGTSVWCYPPQALTQPSNPMAQVANVKLEVLQRNVSLLPTGSPSTVLRSSNREEIILLGRTVC